MQQIIDFLEKIFYADIYKNINLYIIISSIVKYFFVFIVLYFIYIIVKMIYLDIKQTTKTSKQKGSYLQLIGDVNSTGIQRIYYLNDNTTIGRSSNNIINIDSPYLSKNHAKIFKANGRFVIEDLNSANGTKINNQIINEAFVIEDKDVLSFAGFEFLFVAGDDYEA